VKVHFADMCWGIDKGKKKRRILVFSAQYLWFIEIMPNKDKQTKKTKPFLYQTIRRFPPNTVTSVTLSTLADNWMLFQVTGEPDELVEVRKKTELLAQLLRINTNMGVNFNDTMIVTGLKNKKVKYIWQINPKGGPDGGLFKGKKVLVGAGAGRDAYPNLREPEKPVVTQTNYKETYATKSGDSPRQQQQPQQQQPLSNSGKRPMPGTGPKKMTGGPGPKKMMNPGPKKMMSPGPKKAPMKMANSNNYYYCYYCYY